MLTLQAFDLLHSFPVNLVILFHVSLAEMLYFIMAESAREEFQTDRALLRTPPSVVWASKLHLLLLLDIILLRVVSNCLRIFLISFVPIILIILLPPISFVLLKGRCLVVLLYLIRTLDVLLLVLNAVDLFRLLLVLIAFV